MGIYIFHMDIMRNLAWLIIGNFLIVVLAACDKEKIYNEVKIIGHAGNGLENMVTFFHDNSFESVHLALNTEGCNGVEVDVRLSADGTLWLYHDSELENETNGVGCVENCSDVYLESLQYSTLKKEKLIRLSEVPFHLLNGKSIYLDLRHYNVCQSTFIDNQKMVDALSVLRDEYEEVQFYPVTTYLPLAENLLTKGFEVYSGISSMEEYVSIVDGFPSLSGILAKYADIKPEDVSLIQSHDRKVVLYEMRSVLGTKKL